MISILIPVFNTDVIPLVSALHHQLLQLSFPAEIVVMDDGSEEEWKHDNKQIQTFSNTHYIELPQNVGRLKIRSRLAENARYEWLLFLDGDSEIIHPHFLENYIQTFSKGHNVIIGGRAYTKQPPQDCRLILHWKYGTWRENSTVHKTGFMTNNFCIRQKVFQQLSFPLPLQGYGHEDTWIGMQLEQLKAQITYINNQVLHKHLEPAPVFLKKTHEALTNLQLLVRTCDTTLLRRHVRLYNWYYKLRKSHLHSVLPLAFQLFQTSMLKNFSSCRPSLRLFDVYRLCYFTLLMQRVGNKAIIQSSN